MRQSFVSGLLESRRNRSLTAAQLSVIQRQKLRYILQHTIQAVPFYRRLYGEKNVNQVQFEDVEIIDKEIILARPDEFFADPELKSIEIEKFLASGLAAEQLFKNRYIISATSGTSGQIGYFVNNRSSFDVFKGVLIERNMGSRLNLMRALLAPGLGRYRMAMVSPPGGAYISTQTTIFQPAIASLFITSKRYSIFSRPDELVSALNNYKPHYLYSYPSIIGQLAEAASSGELHISPEAIAVSSEPFPIAIQQKIAETFPNARLAETYSASECLAIASRCDHGKLHVNSDFVYVEPIDRQGKLVPPGELSDAILITNLVNTVHPIIRYRLTDRVRITPEMCLCGSKFPIMELQGRSDDTFYLIDNTGKHRSFPPIPLEIICLGIPKLQRYQICHSKQNVIDVSFVAETKDEKTITTELCRRLSGHFEKILGSGQVTINVKPVSSIERPHNGGKIRQIYSNVSMK